MYRTFKTLATLSLATVFCASFASAQSVTGTNKPFSFGGALGAAIPVGDLGNTTSTGFSGTLILGLNTPSLPVNFRIDGAYNTFGIKRTDENVRVTSFTGNVILNVPTTSPVRPYLIGGAGLYNTGTTVSGVESANNFGFNIGGGVVAPFRGFNAFLEARYHHALTEGSATQFIPISLGVMF